MNGRSVYKEGLINGEGQKYSAWLQLDFKEPDESGTYKMKQFHQNYGYDLKEVLAKYPIKELGNDQQRERLIQSLERGNRQSITLDTEGKEQKVFLEANPQFKSLNIYDSNMKRVYSQSLKENNTQEQSQKQEKKLSQTQQQDESEDMPKASKKKSKRNRQSIA